MKQSATSQFVMAACIIVLAAYLVYPIILLMILSFNVAETFLFGDWVWGTSNWVDAWGFSGLWESIWNSFLVWFLESLFSFPIAIDGDGSVMKRLRVRALPTTILIAPDGEIVMRQAGYTPATAKPLLEAIESLFAAQKARGEKDAGK